MTNGFHYWSLICLVIFCNAAELPCGRRQPGDKCLFDEQCDGLNTKCLNKVCSCPDVDFEDYQTDNNTRVCRPAPRTVNATCGKNCKPPLVCQNGKCVCWKAKQVGNQCVLDCPSGEVQIGQVCVPVAQTLNGQCSTDAECLAPFTMCNNKQCTCVPGLQKTAGGCVPSCPDGSAPGAVCRLRYLYDRALQQNVEQMDTCPRGQHCVTYGKPNIGHCCKLYCPYGDPDLKKSCKRSDLLQNSNVACPETTTHYCQSVDNSGARDRICCPRPCREPTPFYNHGVCLHYGHLDDVCGSDEQCEGGVTMACVDGACRCRDGFAKSGSGPFPTCVRSGCNPITSVVVNNQCVYRAAYSQPCQVSAQCLVNMQCSDGICACKCGFSYGLGACYNPQDPLNVSPFLCSVQSILAKGQKPDPKCANVENTSATGGEA